MTLETLRFLIYEIGRRLKVREFYVIGSAAIAATLPTPPEGELTATRDADVIPFGDDQLLMDKIDLYMGKGSPLDESSGYYAHGVSSETPKYAPRDWRIRTVEVLTSTAVGHCMEPHDIVLSKLGAGREKDLAFARELAKLGHLNRGTLLERLGSVDCPNAVGKIIAALLA